MIFSPADADTSVRLAPIVTSSTRTSPSFDFPSTILQVKIKLTNSLVGRGHEGGSGSNKEGEKEEGTHLDSLLERLLVNGLC